MDYTDLTISGWGMVLNNRFDELMGLLEQTQSQEFVREMLKFKELFYKMQKME